MNLEEINSWLIERAKNKQTVIRLQTGDPGLYGVLVEIIQALDKEGIESSIVPGVSSALAAAAAAGGLIGGGFSLKIKPQHLRHIFAYTTLAASAFMLFNALFALPG